MFISVRKTGKFEPTDTFAYPSESFQLNYQNFQKVGQKSIKFGTRYHMVKRSQPF
jgi:hypothetical protein